MVRLLFAIFRYYPLIMVPSAVLMAELAWYMKRKGSRSYKYYFAFSVVLVISSGVWIYFRGDLYADKWLKQLFFEWQ